MVSSAAITDDIQVYDSNGLDEVPYEEERRGYSFRNMKKNPNSASFASKIDRFAVLSERSKSPAPGSYDISPAWDKVKGVLPIGTKPTESRVQRRVDSPGPGDYDVGRETWDQRAKRRNRKNIMLCTSSRIGGDRPSSLADGPGPGYYDPQLVDGSISKRTFNVLMSPDLMNRQKRYQ
jgi:hypothetical protein